LDQQSFPFSKKKDRGLHHPEAVLRKVLERGEVPDFLGIVNEHTNKIADFSRFSIESWDLMPSNYVSEYRRPSRQRRTGSLDL